MSNTIRQLLEKGQSIWCDNISRHMIDSGELQRLIDLGVTGVTSNPTIFMKAITGTTDYDKLFDQLIARGLDGLDIYEGLVLPDIADAADLLKPVFDATNGTDGYVSLEVNPKLAYDTDATVAEGERLFTELGRPNVMIKVPATKEGIPAIEALIAKGINVNVTLIFGPETHEQVMTAYIAGLKRLDADKGDLSKVASVASFFISRVDGAIDKILEDKNADLAGRAAIANAKIAYANFEEVFGDAFAPLAAKGARVQRPLWASTSAKNPAYPDTMYVDGLVGPHTVNTLPPPTLEATLDHGKAEITIQDNLAEARTLLAKLDDLGINVHGVTEQLGRVGVELFAKSFDDLLTDLAEKQQQLRTAG